MPVEKKQRKQVEVEHVSPDDLQLWEKNPRKNDKAVDRVVGLITAHGFVNPIVATRDGVVRAGNTRLKAARKMGLPHVPVIFVEFKDEKTAELFSIADNKSSEWADWDKDKLIDLFDSLPEDMSAEREALSGFTAPELEGLKMNQDSAESDFATDAGDKDKPGQTEYWAWVKFDSKKELDQVMGVLSNLKGGKHEIDRGKILELTGSRAPTMVGAGYRRVRKTRRT